MSAARGSWPRAAVVLSATLQLALAHRTVAQAAPTDTVTTEVRVQLTGGMTEGEVRRRAVEEALAEAVRRVAGVRVQSGILSVREERSGAPLRDDFVSVVQLDAAGRAVDYTILDDAWVTTRHPELGAQLYYRLRLRATVALERGTAVATQRLSLALNATSLRVRGPSAATSDEIVATVTSTFDAQLVLIVVAGDSAQRLFPNAYVPAVILRANTATPVPAADWRERGLRLRADLPAGITSRREVLLAVATRLPALPFMGHTTLELQRWLVEIPLDQRALAWAPYEVSRE